MRIVKLKARADGHDQLTLLAVARVAQNGMDFAEHERRREIVALLLKDKSGTTIADGMPLKDVAFREQLQLDETQWSELCRCFMAYRWAGVSDAIAELKERLFEAKQVDPPADKKAGTRRDG